MDARNVRVIIEHIIGHCQSLAAPYTTVISRLRDATSVSVTEPLKKDKSYKPQEL